MKYHIEKNTVQETLIIPLYGRKKCTEKFPQLFKENHRQNKKGQNKPDRQYAHR